MDTKKLTPETAWQRYQDIYVAGIDQFELEQIMPVLTLTGRSYQQLIADADRYAERCRLATILKEEVPALKAAEREARQHIAAARDEFEAVKKRHHEEMTAVVVKLRAASDASVTLYANSQELERETKQKLEATAKRELRDSDRPRDQMEAAIIDPRNLEPAA